LPRPMPEAASTSCAASCVHARRDVRVSQHDLVLARRSQERLWARTAGWAGVRGWPLALASHADRDGVVDNIAHRSRHRDISCTKCSTASPEVRRSRHTSMAQP
jgi:hypothetical protein